MVWSCSRRSRRWALLQRSPAIARLTLPLSRRRAHAPAFPVTTLPGARYDIAFPMVNVVLGLLIIAFLMFQPRGLAHLYRQGERFARFWPFPY